MKYKFINKLLAAVLIPVLIFPLLFVGSNRAILAAAPAQTSAPTNNISISASPSRLSAAGDVTVTITVTNTNTGYTGYSGGNDADADYIGHQTASPIPSSTPYPTATDEISPSPSDSPDVNVGGTYYNVQIQNAYGASFSPADIPAGSTATFKATLHVTDTMIGMPLTFTVVWQERFESVWQNHSYQVQLTIGRANAAYMTLTRTMSKSSAVRGEQVVITYTLVNTGSHTLNNIRLVDEKIAGVNPMVSPFSLASGKSFTYKYTYTMGSESVVSKPVATFTPSGSSAVLSVSAPKQTLGLMNAQLSKEIVIGEADENGVMLTLYLTNNGNCLLSGLIVRDDLGKTIASGFNLAIGETKIIEYFVPNPETVRYVVFSISGMNENTPFYDNTSSCPVRPYIDPSQLGIDFSVEISEPLNADNVISLIFNIRNTGSMDYTDVSIEEKEIGILIDQFDVLRPSATALSIPRDIKIDEPRKLVFTLSAKDLSGNEYTYNLALNANYEGEILPAGETPKPADPTVVEDPELGHKLDSLLTSTGEKLSIIYTVLGVLVAIVLVAVIALAVAEIMLKKKLKDEGADQGGDA